MRPLFIEVLRMAGELGMVKLGNLSTDGTKIEANASRHKAMSYGYMGKELARLENEIEQLLAQADRVDAEQDAALGSRRGDELPDELKRREERLAKIRVAKERLEAEARVRAEEEQRERDAAEAERQAAGKKRRGKEPAPVDPTPGDKAQTNFTDADSKIMKRSNKGFDYCYNAQAVVDSENQIIVAAEMTTAANDKQQAVPLAQAAMANLASAGIERPLDDQGQPLPTPPMSRTRTRKPRWRKSSAPHRTATGRVLYAARKHIMEPMFGQIKRVRGFRKFLLRGLKLVSAEWQLICLTHNLLKTSGRVSSSG
jgi:hypothetical protein